VELAAEDEPIPISVIRPAEQNPLVLRRRIKKGEAEASLFCTALAVTDESAAVATRRLALTEILRWLVTAWQAYSQRIEKASGIFVKKFGRLN